MEPLWSPAVATGSNRWQMGRRPERLRQAQTIAVGCDRLPRLFMVRRGSTVRVRQRALQKPRKSLSFRSARLAEGQCAVGMELFMELSGPRTTGDYDTFRPESGAVGGGGRRPQASRDLGGRAKTGKCAWARSPGTRSHGPNRARRSPISVPEVSVGRHTLGIRSDEVSPQKRSKLS